MYDLKYLLHFGLLTTHLVYLLYFVVSLVTQWWSESVILVPNRQRRPLWRLESTSRITCTWQNSKTVPGLVLASSRCRIFLSTLPLKFFTTRRRCANNNFFLLTVAHDLNKVFTQYAHRRTYCKAWVGCCLPKQNFVFYQTDI